jgi:hypothetical protein
MNEVRNAEPGSSGPGLWFVIPAYKRVELSAICFEQIHRACKVMQEAGIDTTCVVIADDANLDAAERLGFRTIRHSNLLGAKLNAGYQLAAEGGADFVCPLGSDSWIEPRRFFQLPQFGQLLCTRNYTVVNKQATKRMQLNVAYRGGVGSRVIPIKMLAECGYRPLQNRLMRGADTATLRTIEESHHVEFVYSELHPMEVLSFQSDIQLNRYAQLKEAFLVKEKKSDPFDGIEEFYDMDLIDRVKSLYAPPTKRTSRKLVMEGAAA